MSKPIEQMDYKELRAEVQRLSDNFARMQRKYEDLLYNLDFSNFSGSFIKETDGMKSEIKQTAAAITTKVSEEELSEKLKNYSTIEQTAESIISTVFREANIDAEVISSLKDAVDTSKFYCIQSKNNEGKIISEQYYYYNTVTETWSLFSGDSIYSVFKQTDEGFEMRGNVIIDGDTVITKNLRLSGNVTWDMSNSPVLAEYSTNNKNWHAYYSEGDLYMHMSFDGGKTWSNTTQIVGIDGRDGLNGTDATVTPEAVFNALTDNGAKQGIFAAFVNKENRIYINAEYISSKIANVDDVLYIGDFGERSVKQIVFTHTACINSDNDNIEISALITSIGGGSIFLNGDIYLTGATNIFWGDNQPVCVFGAEE